MSDVNGRNRRRLKNYLINPRMQLLMYLPYVVTLVAFVVTNHLVVRHVLDEFSRLTLDPNPSVFTSLTDVYSKLVRISVAGLLTAAVLGFVLVTVLSHRLLGPLYNIHRHVRRMRDGVVEGKIILRKGDHLRDLADDLNVLTEKCVASGVVRSEGPGQ